MTISIVDFVKQKGFHCAHLNVRSLFNKFDLFTQMVEECNGLLHVLGLSETWLSNGIPDEYLNIKGYQLIRNDRTWGDPNINGNIKRGGGVCLYIKEQVIWSDQKYKHLNRSVPYIESQWIEIINPNSKNIIITNMYRPPDGDISDFITTLETAMENLDFTKNEIFLMGDFNIDYLDNADEKTKKLKTLLK